MSIDASTYYSVLGDIILV